MKYLFFYRHTKGGDKMKKPGEILFSPAMCSILSDDPGFMDQLIENATCFMSSNGAHTSNRLVQRNEESIAAGAGIFWYELTSDHGNIILAGEAFTGDIYNMTAAEFPNMANLDFAELHDLPQYPQNN